MDARDDSQRGAAQNEIASARMWIDQQWPPETPHFLTTGAFVWDLAADPALQQFAVDVVLDPHREHLLTTLSHSDDEQMQQLMGTAVACRDTWIDSDTSLFRIARLLARYDTLHTRAAERRPDFAHQAFLAGIHDDITPDHALSTVATSHPAQLADAASLIGSGRIRAHTLAAVAEALAATDPEHADQLARQAVTTAADLTTDRDNVLRDVAAVLAASHPAWALKAAKSIPERWVKVEALGHAAAGVAATDPKRTARLTNRAVKSAGRISEPLERDTAYGKLAAALASAAPEPAVEAATRITDDGARAESLAGIAAAATHTDRDLSARIADLALTTALGIGSSSGRDYALMSLTEAWQSSIPTMAIDAAHRIASDWWRATFVANVAAAVAPSDVDLASQLAHEALDTATGITDDESRGELLGEIAARLGKALPAVAIDAATAIIDTEQRELSLGQAAELAALTDPSLSIATAASITDDQIRDEALSDTAATVGRSQPALALDAAGRISDADRRAAATVRVAIESAETPAAAVEAALASRVRPDRLLQWVTDRWGADAGPEQTGKLMARAWVDRGKPWLRWSVLPSLCPTHLTEILHLASR